MRSVSFGNTYLRNYAHCPEGLYKYWLGDAGKDMSDLYGKIKRTFHYQEVREAVWLGFELASVVPNVPKIAEKVKQKRQSKQLKEREKSWSTFVPHFEPSSSTSSFIPPICESSKVINQPWAPTSLAQLGCSKW
jgi:hypothetical protein